MWQGAWDDGRLERRWDLDPGSGGGEPVGDEPGGPEGGEPLPPEPWDPPEPEGGEPSAPEGPDAPEGTVPIGRPGEGEEEPGGAGTEEVRIYEWRTARDARVCPICGPLDGGRWEGDDGPFPPAHDGCRCARVLVAVETRTVRRAPLGEYGARRRW